MVKKHKDEEWLVLLLLLLLFLLKNFPLIIPLIKPKKKDEDGTVPPSPEPAPAPYTPPSPYTPPQTQPAPYTPTPTPAPIYLPSPAPTPQPSRPSPFIVTPPQQPRPIPFRVIHEIERRDIDPQKGIKYVPQPIQTNKNAPGIDPLAVFAAAAAVAAGAAIKLGTRAANPVFGVLPLFKSRQAIIIRRIK
jgi:hypothetical protein